MQERGLTKVTSHRLPVGHGGSDFEIRGTTGYFAVIVYYLPLSRGQSPWCTLER